MAVVCQHRPDGPEPKENSYVMASFSCCRLRQGEGDHAGVRVAQAQPARRPSHLKRPGTEPRLVAGRCSKVKVLIAVPQRKGNVSEGRAAPVDGSGGQDEQSPGRGAGGVGKRVKL